MLIVKIEIQAGNKADPTLHKLVRHERETSFRMDGQSKEFTLDSKPAIYGVLAVKMVNERMRKRLQAFHIRQIAYFSFLPPYDNFFDVFSAGNFQSRHVRCFCFIHCIQFNIKLDRKQMKKLPLISRSD